MFEVEQLRERLLDMGFETEENEEDILKNAIERVEQTILNYCNCENVPQELYFVALDMACGEYLAASRCQGSEKSALKSISEGDISVTFGDEEPVEVLADKLLCKGREEMVSFRRIKW